MVEPTITRIPAPLPSDWPRVLRGKPIIIPLESLEETGGGGVGVGGVEYETI